MVLRVMTSSAISILAVLSSATVAIAQSADTPVFSSKDWRLEDRADGVCVAATTAKAHHLEILLDKSGKALLEVRIRPDVEGVALAMKAALDKKKETNYSFAKAQAADSNALVFWNIPRGTDDLLAYLKRESKFDVTPVEPADPKAKAISFSLKGSSAVITELQKRCNANQALVHTAFEKAFLPKVVATVDASKLTPEETAHLKSLLVTAREAFNASNATQAEIEALTAQYLDQINELAKLRRNVDRLTQQEIARLKKSRADSEAAITKAKSANETLRPQIATEEAKLSAANTKYERAYNVWKPLEAEYGRLASAIDAANSDLDHAESAASQARSRVDRAEREIDDLESSLSSMHSRRSPAQSAVDHARSQWDSAQRDLRNFNPETERRRLIQNDFRLGSIDSEMRDVRSRILSARSDEQRAESDMSRAESAYEACRARPDPQPTPDNPP
ncbi:MAG TPA: hypothetical protein VM432_09935, partial [Bdellovibrionales bacterium]|nr:hypothetical protein [Bdellovibrionales bacterium]